MQAGEGTGGRESRPGQRHEHEKSGHDHRGDHVFETRPDEEGDGQRAGLEKHVRRELDGVQEQKALPSLEGARQHETERGGGDRQDHKGKGHKKIRPLGGGEKKDVPDEKREEHGEKHGSHETGHEIEHERMEKDPTAFVRMTGDEARRGA